MPRKINYTEEQKEEIRRLYLDERKSARQISEIFNCSNIHIINYLKRMNIPRRDNSESQIGIKRKPYTLEQREARSERVKQDYINHPELRETRSKQFKTNWKDAKTDGRINEIVKNLSNSLKRGYESGEIQVWNKNLTKETDERVRGYAEKKLGLKREDLSKRNLENNPMNSFESRKRASASLRGIKLEEWGGFISKEPYDEKWNEKFKRTIRKRDNQICMKCGKHQEKEGRALTVHHINYDKKLTIPQNCCAVCRRCNIEVNSNRPHWTKFFQSLLSERYNYKYSDNQPIIQITPT